MILYADFETSTTLVDGQAKVYLWGCVSEDNTIREYGVSLSSFFNFIYNLPEIPTIYFHNISFDGVFIVHYLIDNGYKFVEKITSKTSNKTFTWIADYNTNIYTLAVKDRGVIIKFLDSYKILICSVKSLGAVLNMPKLELEYDNYTSFKDKKDVPPKVLDYLFRDIDIVREFMKRFSKSVNTLKTTLAGTMYNEFREFYGIYNFAKDFGNPFSSGGVITKDEWIRVKASYYGGFTAIAPRYKEVDIKGINGHSYDWNSMYPSVMMNYRMPYGKPTTFKVEDTDLELYEILIYKADKWDDLLPDMLPSGNDGAYVSKYLSHAEDIKIVIWKDEWEEIRKSYNIDFSIVRTMYFRSKYVFKEFIEKIKKEKIEATNPSDRFIAKVKQNSLYGKFGQSIERVSKILIYDADKKEKGKRYGKNEEWVECKKISYTKNIPYMPIASYITSMSRTLLFRAIRDNRKTFIYCDTDSLYLTDEAVGLKLDDKEYGALKLEHRFDRFKALKLKCYMLNDINDGLTVKVAGLPDDAQKKLNFDNFYRGYKLTNDKLQKKHQIGGIILELTDYTL